MVITIEVANFTIKKVLINQDSSVDILYMSTFRQLLVLEAEIRMDTSTTSRPSMMVVTKTPKEDNVSTLVEISTNVELNP
ncbi:hypothetical protein CR513_17509, partial [Mucuna pruriens]